MTRSQKIGCLILVGVPIFCVILVLLGLFVFGKSSQAELQTSIQKAKSVGLCVEPTDLPTGPAASENSAATFAEIQKLTRRSGPYEKAMQKALVYSSSKSATQSRVLAIEAFDDLKPVLDLVSKATSFPSFYKPIDFSKAETWDFDYYDYVKGSVRLELNLARWKIDSNDFASMEQYLANAYKIADQLKYDPAFVGMLVQISLMNLADSEVERTLSLYSANSAAVSACKKALRFRPQAPDLKKYISYDTVYVRSVLSSVKSQSYYTGRKPTRLDRNFDRLFFNSSMKNKADSSLLRKLTEYWPKLSSDPEKWNENFKVLRQYDLSVNSETDLVGKLLSIVAMEYSRPATFLGLIQMHRRLISTTLEIIDAKQRTGRFPTTISKTQEHEDPFSSKQLVYRPSKTGFLLYSVGRDGVDNGGAPRTAKNTKKYDVIVQVR